MTLIANLITSWTLFENRPKLNLSGMRSFLGLSALAFAAAEGSAEGVGLKSSTIVSATDQEEECAAGAAGDCALSLRQLRALPAQQAALQQDPPPQAEAAAAAANATQEDTSHYGAVPGDLPDGVPGGWGEAADFAGSFSGGLRHGGNHSENPANATLGSMGRWGSCQQFGCITYYAPWLGCQCNLGCEKHGSCCYDYGSRCAHHYHHQHHPAPAPAPAGHQKILTLFHQTSAEAAELIVQNGFRPGTQGWCGGGIYFATSIEATNTKAIGPDSHKGQMLQAQVNVGKVKYMSASCDRGLSGQQVANEGYDSVSFNPGDGQEYIVYDKNHVLSVKKV